MAIDFQCHACNKVLRTSDDKAGARAACPECGEAITVPYGDQSPESIPTSFEPLPSDPFSQTFGTSPRSQVQPATPDMKSCPMCGESIRAVALKCRYCGEMMGTPAIPSQAGGIHEPQLEYAGFWLRFVAYIIDGILLGIVDVVVRLGFGLPALRDPFVPAPPADAGKEMMTTLIQILVGWLYFASFEASETQATPGKMALGLMVTDDMGERLTFGRATGRFFAKILSGVTLLIGYIIAAFTARKQALHDLIAGCLVIRKPRHR